MAEFRKYFYALGLASLLVGVSSTASAAVQCTGSVANPPIIREESFTELIGDIILDCTGGTPTTEGASVLPINVTITVSSPLTSRLLDISDAAGGFFNEALLIIDEPNHPEGNPDHRDRPLLACGDSTGAPYQTLGVCVIEAPADQRETYNGDRADDEEEPRPNVFQGRVSPVNNFQVVWNGVPFDPPGTVGDPNPVVLHRILRFTNIRVASPSAAPVGSPLTTVFVEININGQDITLSNRVLPVASVQKGIEPQAGIQEESFLQCEAQDETPLNPVTFREGFASSFKVKAWGEIERNGELNGSWVLDTTPSGSTYGYRSTELRQNVPGGLYFTESGFTSPSSHASPSPNNAPISVGTAQDLTGGVAISNTTGVASAGVATNGTRIILTFKDVPAGTTIEAPSVAFLYRAGTNEVTGVAIRTSTASSRGDGPLNTGGGAVTTSISPSNAPITGGRVVYEMMFTRSQIREDLRIPLFLTYAPNLVTDQPEVNKSALVTGGFAPFALSSDNFAVAARADATVGGGFLPIPRFVTQSGDQKLFIITKCSCNLLFPFTTNAATTNGNFDTGIAIANTSKLPSANSFLQGTDQQGGVQFWYFPSRSTEPAVATQCANTVTVGSCDAATRKIVKAGETLTYILSQTDTTRWGLDNRAKGFTGYIVAQTQFQYCHAFAYISPEGAFPLTNGMSVGYLALILDKQVHDENSEFGGENALPVRTFQPGEALNH